MASAIYYHPIPPANSLTHIQQTLRSLNARQLPTRWALDHKYFASTPLTTTSSQNTSDPIRLQHIFTASHLGEVTHLHISHHAPPNTDAKDTAAATSKNTLPDGAVITIPAARTADFTSLVLNKLGALWARRLAHTVQNGAVFEFGECVVRIGELVRSGPPAAQAQRPLVVEIEILAGNEEEEMEGVENVKVEDGEVGKTEDVQAQRLKLIEEVWDNLDIKGAKSTVRKPAKGERAVIEAEVRMWCDVLALRTRS